MHIFSKRLIPYTIFVLGYMAVFTVTAIMQGNHEFMFYEGTMAIIIAVLVYMDKRVMFSHTVLCGMAIWGFVHLAGGLISVPVEWTQVGETTPVLYDVRLSPYLPKYDQIVHAFGFGISLILTHEALQAHLKRSLPINAAIGFTLFFVAMGVGALNELIEFVAVLSIANTEVGGYKNTGWDLVSNSVGAILALIFLKFRRVGKQT